MFDVTDASPFLELKQTLHSQIPHSSRLETVMPFSKGFIVAGGGINGYLGVYENMVRRGALTSLIGRSSYLGRTLLAEWLT